MTPSTPHLAAALAVAAGACIPSPDASYAALSATQTAVLTVAAPAATSTVHVAVQDLDTNGVELAVEATVTWSGAGGAPSVTATLGPDQGPQIDGGFTPPSAAGLALVSAGLGTLTVAAGQACTDLSPPCLLDFTLELAQTPATEDVTLTWTAVATIETRASQQPPIAVTVIP